MTAWTTVAMYSDIRFERTESGIAKITIDRPEVHNAFRPETVTQLIDAFARVRDDATLGCVLLTGAGDKAFCSGGDQRYKSHAGGYVGGDGIARLNVLDLQRQIRTLPKPVIAMVAGYAIGGGHVLHVVCDLSIASDNAVFGQTGPKVGSFDAGYGATMLARIVGHKKAREIWYLCRQYSAQQALEMGLVNAVVPRDQVMAKARELARTICLNGPLAVRACKQSAKESTFLGLTQALENEMGHSANVFMSEDAKEGIAAFKAKRPPVWKGR